MSRKMISLIKKNIKGFILLAILFFVFVVWGIVSGVNSSHTFQFVVSPGQSVSSVANSLKDAGIIDSVSSFKMAVRLRGGRVHAGDYDIPRKASAWKAATILASGMVATTDVVIPEGLTIKQIKNLLNQMPTLYGDVECAVGNTVPVCNLHDGDIFPDTYRVARGTSRLAVLDLARKKMISVREQIKINKLPSPLKSWNEVLTLASIVQKETPMAKEMPIVASVYLNRLNKGMRLQADPTVVYALTGGLGDMRGMALLSGHLKIDSPYNTYKNSGLPPAPISNVGIAAIRAVLYPADTHYLFFVADGHGGHKFSDTYEQHLRNHAKWREIKKSKK